MRCDSLLLPFLLVLLWGCGADPGVDSGAKVVPTASSDTDTDTDADTDADTDTDTDTDTVPDGEALYALYCAFCHGAEGEGSAAGPTLADSLSRSDEELMVVILEGEGSMPPSVLSEEEAGAIVAYLRELVTR